MQKTLKSQGNAVLKTVTKVLTAALCASLFLPSAKAATLQRDYQQTVNWLTPYILYDDSGTPQSGGKDTVQNTITIASDKDVDLSKATGETVTFSASISTSPEAKVTGFSWKVNGDTVRTASVSKSGSYTTKYSLQVDSPITVSCEFDGTIDSTDGEKRTISQFYGNSSPVITVGTSKDIHVGDMAALSPATQTTFTPSTSGKYEIVVVAGDGTSTKTTAELLRGTTYTARFTNGNTSFYNTTVSMKNGQPNTGKSSVLLSCKSLSVDIIKNPSMYKTGDGEDASFEVIASSSDLPLTYQWYETLDGKTETRIDGATSSKLQLKNASVLQNKAAYRCKVSNGEDTCYTKYAALHVYGKPSTAPDILLLDNLGRPLTGGWETQQVTLTATIPSGTTVAGDGELGLRYSLDDGKTWTELTNGQPAIVLSENQEYDTTLRVQTYNKKWDTQYKEVTHEFKGDMKSPVVQISGLPTSWANKEAAIKIVATDKGCGLAAEPYSWDGGVTWTSEVNKTVSTNQELLVCAKDRFGHITYTKVVIDKFDMTAPSVEVSGNRTEWGTDSITLTATATDDMSGLQLEAFSWDNGKTWSSKKTYVADENKTVQLAVRDRAGNIASQDIVVNRIDKTAPTLKVEGNPTDWTNKNVTLVIKAEDTVSGLASEPYSWDGGKTWTNESTKEFEKNETVQVYVRDNTGNTENITVDITRIDKELPSEFKVTGNPAEWTNQPATLTVELAQDAESGLATEAYNWNETGWTTSNKLTVSENSVVTVKIRDKAGNERKMDVTVDKVDTKEPTITSIDGIPAEMQTEPANISIIATDAESGLDLMAYSFDDGATWQSEPTITVSDEQAIGLKVRDKAGNIAYYPFMVKNVDATGPSLTISYLNVTTNRQSVIVLLNGYDARSKNNCEYCFDYNEADLEANVWTTSTQGTLKVGQTVVVATRDELGNVTSEMITPSIYDVTKNENTFKLFTNDYLEISGYTLGPIDGGQGLYLDRTGLLHEYGTYKVEGKAVYAIPVKVEGAPIGGGILKGHATLSGTDYPIYWNNECTKTETLTGGAGYFFLDPSALYKSAQTATVKVTLKEYDKDNNKVLNSDELSAVLMLDFTPPVVNMSLDTKDGTNTLTIEARDPLSGLYSVKYKIRDKDGESDWMDYTAPITLTRSGEVTVSATDKVGNQSVTTSKKLTISGSVSDNTDVSGSFYYRSSLFEHYLFGTNQTSILKKTK